MKRLLVGLLNVLGAAYLAVGIVVGFVGVFIVLMIMGFGPFGLPVWLGAFLGALVMSIGGVVAFFKTPVRETSLLEDLFE